MQVSKFGDQLAVPLPDAVVEELGLKEGDEVGIYRLPARDVEGDPEVRRAEALRIIRSLSWQFPPDFKFNREEANEVSAPFWIRTCCYTRSDQATRVAHAHNS